MSMCHVSRDHFISNFIATKPEPERRTIKYLYTVPGSLSRLHRGRWDFRRCIGRWETQHHRHLHNRRELCRRRPIQCTLPRQRRRAKSSNQFAHFQMHWAMSRNAFAIIFSASVDPLESATESSCMNSSAEIERHMRMAANLCENIFSICFRQTNLAISVNMRRNAFAWLSHKFAQHWWLAQCACACMPHACQWRSFEIAI